MTTLAQRDSGIRPSPSGSLISCHGQQGIFDAGNVMDRTFRPSLDAESEAFRVSLSFVEHLIGARHGDSEQIR
jgi:hypothetical protein